MFYLFKAVTTSLNKFFLFILKVFYLLIYLASTSLKSSTRFISSTTKSPFPQLLFQASSSFNQVSSSDQTSTPLFESSSSSPAVSMETSMGSLSESSSYKFSLESSMGMSMESTTSLKENSTNSFDLTSSKANGNN